MNWDQYFNGILDAVRAKSQDRNSTYGALVADRQYRILATGYNGLPRGVRYREEYHARPDKYMYFVHAEQNAVFNAAAYGVALRGSIMYVIHPPCIDCTKAIIQSGIQEVAFREQLPQFPLEMELNVDNWRMHQQAALDLLAEARVSLRRMEL